MYRDKTARLLAIVAFVVSLFTLFVVLRQGGSISTNDQRVLGTKDENLQSVKTRSEDRLKEIGINLREGGNGTGAADEVAAIRRDLSIVYENTSEETQEQWNEMQPGLEKLEAQLRQGTAEALETLELLLAKLKVDVRSDED